MKRSLTFQNYLTIILLLLGVMAAGTSLTAMAAKSCDTTYNVRSGDTLKKIGDKYGVSPYRIVNFNELSIPYTLWVGTKLCIPEKPKYEKTQPKLSNKYANQAAADFNVVRDGEVILVRVVNYATQTVFLVKADDASDEVKNFVKLGALNPAKGKEFRFQLPKDLRKGKALWICMKDQTSDLRICRYLHATR